MLLSLIKRIFKSISFITFLISAAFGMLAVLLVLFPDNLFESYPKLLIKNPDNIKFILAFTIGGLFTLTIFTYTMLMNVLNRSISNYSPRLIPLILHERHHQIILGTTSGTIIYCLVLSLFVSSESNDKFPTLGAPLTIFFGIVCVFMFIYFIHAVSQSIHVNYVVRRSYEHTKRIILDMLQIKDRLSCVEDDKARWNHSISFEHCGYLNAIRREKLLRISAKYNVHFKLLKPMGSFVYEGEAVLSISKELDKALEKKIKRCIAIDRNEAVDVIEIGFKHLVEVAVKASSPAINDPGTSIIVIDYLTQLFLLRKKIPSFNRVDSHNDGVLYFKLIPLEQLKKIRVQGNGNIYEK